MDYPPNATVPIYTDKIFVKALRLPKSADDIKYKGEEIFNKQNNEKKSQINLKQNQAQSNSQNLMNIFESTSEGIKKEEKYQDLTNSQSIKNKNIIDNLNFNLVEDNNNNNNLLNNNLSKTNANDMNNQNDFDGFEFPNVIIQQNNQDKTEIINNNINNIISSNNSNINSNNSINNNNKNYSLELNYEKTNEETNLKNKNIEVTNSKETKEKLGNKSFSKCFLI